MQGSKRPIPPPTNITQEFWARAKEGVLALPYCAACNTYTYYPRNLCVRCMSQKLEWRPVSGQGTIYSYTIVRSPRPGFEDMAPYVVASIDLAEGARMMANVLTNDPESVHIGMPVRVTFQELTPDIHLPQVVPA